jgi:hypothetical protein
MKPPEIRLYSFVVVLCLAIVLAGCVLSPVRLPAVSPTPEPCQSPPGTFKADFAPGTDGSTVAWQVAMTGTYQSIPGDCHLWIITHPTDVNQYWPWSSLDLRRDGTWYIETGIGLPESYGQEFVVGLYLANADADRWLQRYLSEHCREFLEGRCDGLYKTELPLGLTGITSVRVKRHAQSILDDMSDHNTLLWKKADGWSNGSPFWTGWRADHIQFANGSMSLCLDDLPCKADTAACSGQPYASGEYRSRDVYPYGCVEGRFKAARHDGVVTSLFTFYASPPSYQDKDEIDIEILGRDTTRMQVNYCTNGIGGHETMIDLEFDASQDFHTYAFEWSPNTIKWYVDGRLVHTEDGSHGPLPQTPGQIMANLWAGRDVDSWLKAFTYSGSPIYAYYDWIRFSPSSCTVTS